MILSKPD